MTLPRYYLLADQWRRFPPVHIAVGAYLGYGKNLAAPQADQPVRPLLDDFLG